MKLEIVRAYIPRFVAAGIATLVLGAGQLAAVPIRNSAKLIVGANIHVDGDPNTPFVEPFLAANPTDAQNLIGASMIMGDTLGSRIFASRDGGYTWLERIAPSDTSWTGDVQTAFNSQGTAFFAILGANREGKNGLYLFASRDKGTSWERRSFIRYAYPNGTLHSYDHEQLAIDSSVHSRFRDRIYMTALYRTPTNQIGLLSSADGGRTFHGPVPIATGWPFNSPLAIFTDGTIFVPYIDTSTGHAKPWPYERILFVTSPDGGATLSKPHLIARRFLSPNMSSQENSTDETDFDRDSVPQYAVDRSAGSYQNRVYVVWSDQRYYSSRVLFTYSADRGKTWSEPRIITGNLKAGGSQYQPEIAVGPTGIVGISWYDTQGVGPHHYNEFFIASRDGGKTFLPPARVSTASSTPRGDGNSAFTVVGSSNGSSIWTYTASAVNRWASGGDYIGMSVDTAGIFHPYWIDARTGTDQLWTAPITVATATTPLPTLHEADVTSSVTLVYDRPKWDPKRHLLFLPVRLQNLSAKPLYPPFAITVTAVNVPRPPSLKLENPHDQIGVENADNGVRGVGALFRYGRTLSDGQSISSGAVTEARVWQLLLNPFTDQPSFSVTVRGYVPTE